MQRPLAFALFSCLALAVVRGNDQAAAWPQFRGPGGTGVSDKHQPPIEFGPEKNVRWSVPVPSGSSSPIIVGGQIVLTAFEEGKLYTIAYDQSSGQERWRAHAPAKKIEAYHQTEGSPAASTPATDGTRIVSYFGSSGLFCYDLAGHELWRYEMPMAVTYFDFGTGVSPVVADGEVILVRDEKQNSKIVALNIRNGKLIWETKRESKQAFCTPVVFETLEGKQIAVPGYGRMIGYDLRNGTEKWTVLGMPAATCTTPVVVDDTLFFAAWSPGEDTKLPPFDDLIKETGEETLGYITKAGLDKTFMKGFFENQDFDHDGKLTRAEWDECLQLLSSTKNSAFALKLGGSGNVSKSHVIWKQTKGGLPYVPSGIVYQGQYVLVKDGGIVTAFDSRNGKHIYAGRTGVAGKYYSSPVAARGFIYLNSLDDGTITVIKAGAKSLDVAATNELHEGVAATPAIDDDTIYYRTATRLYAFANARER